MSKEFKLTYDPDCRVPATLEEVAGMERPPQMKACRALIRLFAIDLNQRAGLHLDDVIQLFGGVPEWISSQRHVWNRSQVRVKWWRCCDCGTIDLEKKFFGVGTIATCPKCKKVNAVKISEELQETIEGFLKQNPTLDGSALISKMALPPAPMPPFDCPSVDTCGLKARWDSCFDCPEGHDPKSQEKLGDRKAPPQQSHITPRQMLQWAEETDRVLCEEAQSAAELVKKQKKSQEKPGDRKAPVQPKATTPKLSPCPICLRDSLRPDGKCESCGADLGGVNVEFIRAARAQRIEAARQRIPEKVLKGAQVLAAKVEEKIRATRKVILTNPPSVNAACACDGHNCPVCSTAGTQSSIIDHYCHECGTRYCPTCHNIVEAVMAQAYSSCGKCRCGERVVK